MTLVNYLKILVACLMYKNLYGFFSNENAHVIRELPMFVYDCYMQRFKKVTVPDLIRKTCPFNE